MKKYYTYAYLRKDKTPYYIGKGKLINGRKYRITANHGRIKVPPKERQLVLKEFFNEVDAFQHEIYMIAVFGRKDLGTGILHNMTDGGEGSANLSENVKKIISQTHKGKILSEITKSKISKTRLKIGIKMSDELKMHFSKLYIGKGNPNYGKKHSEETLSKIRSSTKNKNLKTRWYVSPENEVIKVENLSEFCQKNNLTYNSMISLYNERCYSHKGYTKYNSKIIKVNSWIGKKHNEESKIKQKESKIKYIYNLIDPNENIYVIKFLSEFCTQNNLSESMIRKISKDHSKRYKGWSAFRYQYDRKNFVADVIKK
jgi:hypothetical protein